MGLGIRIGQTGAGRRLEPRRYPGCGRPPVAKPKVSTTIRLSQEVIEQFKAGGRGVSRGYRRRNRPLNRIMAKARAISHVAR